MTRVDSREARPPKGGASVGIPPRQVTFALPDDAPRYVYDDNATMTLFLAVLSGFFPPGERFFVESVRHYRDQVTDPTLKAQVAGFIGQEAIHAREHERLNDLLQTQGINTRVPELAVATALRLLEKLSPSQQLACTTFMEHFTALLGEQLLTDDRFRSRAEPRMLQMWLWHAMEELEHKSVAYDVYELIGNRRRQRILAFPLVAAVMIPAIAFSWGYLIIQERAWRRPGDLARGAGILFGRRGFVTRILRKMPLFARRDFHPAKHDTRALEAEWQQKLFGDDGSMQHMLKARH
ncbi:MAG: metal-dependent hydrolase [Alcanivorax sp.]|nr:metal-dependent hydrolase [Alcanivorax sp.]